MPIINYPLKYKEANYFTTPYRNLSLSIQALVGSGSRASSLHQAEFPIAANIESLKPAVTSFFTNLGTLNNLVHSPYSMMGEAMLTCMGEVNQFLYAPQDIIEELDVQEQDWNPAKDSLRTILYMALLCSWTMFESLASDLWTDVVNLRPIPLAENVICQKGPDGMKGKLPFIYLSESGFDLRHTMGDLLLKQSAVNLRSYEGIKAAYEIAFKSSPAGEADASLSGIFTGNYRGMVRLELLRNLIAHRGGRVDKKFLDSVVDPVLKSSNTENNMLIIDGPMVSEHIRLSIDVCLQLLEYAGVWLSSNP